MKIQGSQIIVECLKKEKVDTIFCYTGGAVISLFDALYTHGSDIRCIQPRHEQGGTHAADAYARSTGKTGVVVVTSGPGATNTVTGIATAYNDSIPMVIITGQVPTSKIGSDAFQEADIIGMTMPVTKASFLVRSPKELASTIKKAFYIAETGRPGPVLVDIPSDIQKQDIEFIYPKETDLIGYNPILEPDPAEIDAALQLIKEAKKPLVVSGGGVIFSDSAPLLNRFIDTFGIPAVNTLMGHGLNPSNDDLFYGCIGMHGSEYGNYALRHADLIIALGTRFSERSVGKPIAFSDEAKIIHVDIDPTEINKCVMADAPVSGPVKKVLEAFNEAVFKKSHTPWVQELAEYRDNHPMDYNEEGVLKTEFVIETANRIFPEDTIVSVDVGQHQMWVGQLYRFRHPRTLMSSSGLGTMGYGLPAAIGAKIGNPDREVLMISGDGGFQMILQELATVTKYKLNVKMLVVDNGYLGMVRQWQELMYDKRYAEVEMADNPDFAAVARAFGINARTVTNPGETEDALNEMAQANEPMLVHALVDRESNVMPMVPAGKSLQHMITKINASGGSPRAKGRLPLDPR